MENDNAINRLLYELQVLKDFGENIQQRIDYVNAAIAELQMASATLEGLGEDSEEMLVPIGGGSYVRARLVDREKLIVGIGSDVAVEKTVTEAKDDFNVRVLGLEKARASLQKQLDEASTRADVAQRELRKLTQVQEASGESLGNV